VCLTNEEDIEKEKIKMTKAYPCSYCGDKYADTLDHVVPHSYNHVHNKRSYDKKLVIPCCKECNTILSNKLFFTIGERASHLSVKYTKKYKKLLSLPSWSEEELEEVKGSLKEKIIYDNKYKEHVKLKIENCCLVRDISPSIEDVWA